MFTYWDPDFYAKVGVENIGADVVKALKQLSDPDGWLAQALKNEDIAAELGVAKCVGALNKQEYW